MVFYGQHPSGSKRSSIERKYKKGHTHADHQIAVAEGLVHNVLVSGDSTLTDNPDAPPPPPKKKQHTLYLGESSKCSLFMEFTLYLKQVGYERGMLERKQDQNCVYFGY